MPEFSINIPGLLSFLATNSFSGEVKGINQVQADEQAAYGPGNYTPDVPIQYWSMRAMAYLGTLSLLLAAWGAILLRRGRLASSTRFHRAALVGIAFPFLANFAGWILTETGRQPWVVYGLQKTASAVSPTSSALMVGFSLGVFITLYTTLAGFDFWLMRRYARLDPPELNPPAPPASAVPVGEY